MLVTRGCNKGDDASATMATTPAKQWRRCQRDKGVNVYGTLVKMPARCCQQRQ